MGFVGCWGLPNYLDCVGFCGLFGLWFGVGLLVCGFVLFVLFSF